MSAGDVLLLVGTRKGLFRLTSSRERGRWTLEGPRLAGWEVFHATFDPRHRGVAFAAARHDVWGAHLFRSEDSGGSWEQLPDHPRFPEGVESELVSIWHLSAGPDAAPERLYAGVQPAALFVSEDHGASWRWVRSLEEHPTRESWQPPKGGLALHSIQVDPRSADRLHVAVSAGGVYGTENGGESWRALNHGVRADFLPERDPEAGQCVHCLRRHPEAPDRLYQQNHCGTYRSDDGGETWSEITEGLPSEFGYVVGLDPSDPDRCWVIPEESDHMRSVCGGRLRVYESSDAGASWTPRSEGLPQEHVYVTVLREAMDTDLLSPCGVYFGTSAGHVFASPNGREWTEAASTLPRVLSVTAWTG